MSTNTPDGWAGAADPLRLGPGSADVGAVIVGAGLAGLCALHHLLRRGMSARVFESGGGVGGTWFWNRYPGARCDVESVDYSFGFDAALEQEWTWTERYASQPEILAYIEHLADRFDLRRHITFETRVVAAEYNEADAIWTVRTDNGEVVRARICVMASGCLSTPRVPPIPGVETFAGEVIHPGRWPQDRVVDLDGRRVGVLGTGSTGIQLVSALAPTVERLTVLQRTANYSMPAQNGPLPIEEMRVIKATYPERRRIARGTRRGFPLPPHVTTESVFAFAPPERRERLERGWAHGGAIFTSTFGDLGTDRDANRIAADFVREQILATVHDPETAERLCPRDHPLGGKRPCVDTGYYATFNRPNVDLIDLGTTPIVAFTADGLETTAGPVPLDVMIFATGYDAITGSLNAIDIVGRGGRLLRERWEHGPTAYLGLCCAGYPNLFLLTGPGSPSVLCNMTVSIEQHVELMLTLLARAVREGEVALEADADAEARWADHVAEVADGTLLVEANSWYRGSNIPGKPSTFMPYAGGMAAFDGACREIVVDDFRGFRFGADARLPAIDRGVVG
jgi:cyclohexanone monooxygenase